MDRFAIGEKKILSLMKREIGKREILYIKDVGYREFLDDGNSFGVCSNPLLKKRKQTREYMALISDFYSDELLRLRRNNHSSSIRVQGQNYNNFLKESNNYGLGNVLVVYRFYPNKISGYYFVASGDHANAANHFCNELSLFSAVVDDIKQEIDGVALNNSMHLKAKPLLKDRVIDELFFFCRRKKKYIYCFDRHISLTLKQDRIMTLLASGKLSNKGIAETMDVHPRTVEWHIQKIKDKTGIHKKAELVNLAKELIA